MVGTPVARNYVSLYKENATIFVMELNKNVTVKYFTVMIT
jgi:hypothetical protein